MTPDAQKDHAWMAQALALAVRAGAMNEVPVGAVLVCDGALVAEGFNQPISANDPTAHAEIIVLRAAAARLGNYRLPELILYTTLEPCPMCAGAIVHARIPRVVYGAADARAGSAGSVFNLLDTPRLNHRCAVTGGVRAEECALLLNEFFESRR